MCPNKGFADRVEKWLGVIPGIGTYRKKENLRETDHNLRAYISAQLQELKSVLEKVILDLSWQKKLGRLPKINAVVSQLQKMADSIKFANYGYSGIFDLKKIRQEELKKIYEFDLRLVEDIQKIRALGEGLAKNDIGDKLLEKVNDLHTSLQALDKKFRQRNDLLSQYS
ncbi:MAG: hypothetical protein ACPL5I_01500 [Thermodesulfobacteriota bacterium]